MAIIEENADIKRIESASVAAARSATIPKQFASVKDAGGDHKLYIKHESYDSYSSDATLTADGGNASFASANLNSGKITSLANGTASGDAVNFSQLDTKLDSNTPITGATKTKITYDADGLVTAGADATTADIAASTDKNYVTDAQAVVIGNTSGANTGDQVISDATITTTDITTNNATAAKHGFLPKLDGSSTKALLGDGTWGELSGGGAVTVYNDTGSTLSKGEVVYISGESGGVPTGALAIASDDSISKSTIGVVEADILNATSGDIITLGDMSSIDTSSYTAGDVLYLSESVAGGMALTAPTSPSCVVRMGTVKTSHASTGSMEVSVDFIGNDSSTLNYYNGYFLESRDVQITESGGTVSCTLEKQGGGDVTAFFDGKFENIDCTPAQSVNLSVGTDTTPQINYVYVLESTKLLAANTSGFPATEHARVGTFLVQAAASVATDGVMKFHEWSDQLSSVF